MIGTVPLDGLRDLKRIDDQVAAAAANSILRDSRLRAAAPDSA